MALTSDRSTAHLRGEDLEEGIKAVKIFAGALVMRDEATGHLTKGQAALGLHGVGMALEQVDNSGGSAGDLTIRVRRGVFRFASAAGGDAITAADIGRLCYAVDDETVAKTSGSNTRSVAGVIRGLDDRGVWVALDEDALAAYQATRTSHVTVRVATLVGSDVYRVVAPVAGRIATIWSVIEGALTTGDATLTAAIGGTAVTGGVITIAQAASAAGDIDSAEPSAANVVAAGDEISITVGGANETASAANVTVVIARD